MVSKEDQITIDRRFKEAVESDPWASTDFLLNQFQKLAKQPIVIGSNAYNISSYIRMHPDIDETTDLVLRAETYEGKTLFAKADVSEHFIIKPDKWNFPIASHGDITHVYGSRAKTEKTVEKIQAELGLPHPNTISVTDDKDRKNSWVMSEMVDGPTLEELSSVPLVASSTEGFCYGIGRSLAFIYMFGLHDVHFGNIHFDGNDVTIRDVEAPFMDRVYVKPILSKIKREISYSACLFHGSNSEGYLIDDSKERPSMVARSLDFFLAPCSGLDTNGLKGKIAAGFIDFYETMTKSFRTRIRDIMFYGLNDLARDPEYYIVTMNTIYQPDRIIASAYDDVIDDRFDESPKKIFEEIWKNINPTLIESYRQSMS